MNLFLHNIGELDGEPSVERADALIAEPKIRVDYVLANPPFGKKSSMTITNEEGEEDRDALTYERQDFWQTTSNKQLNFLQHIVSMLKVDGKAAVVLPDNVLFEGGAGEKIRRKLLENCDVHTILRLPTGIFYAQGVKANVVFFDNAPKDGRVHTKGVWFYDLRTNKHFTLKTRQLRLDDLKDFVACYNPENRHERKETERFKFFAYDELIARDKASLDIFWLKDDSLENLDDLPPRTCCSRRSSNTWRPRWPRSVMLHRACRALHGLRAGNECYGVPLIGARPPCDLIEPCPPTRQQKGQPSQVGLFACRSTTCRNPVERAMGTAPGR
jgi:type I restriction enzyme M protein